MRCGIAGLRCEKVERCGIVVVRCGVGMGQGVR